eukprot:m.30940 g.30940  ORF g.30940 m.30940 type:complete len:399 (-) comp9353_c0_seq1:529-1725(-)
MATSDVARFPPTCVDPCCHNTLDMVKPSAALYQDFYAGDHVQQQAPIKPVREGVHKLTKLAVALKFTSNPLEFAFHAIAQYCPGAPGDYHPHIIRMYAVYEAPAGSGFTHVLVLERASAPQLDLYGLMSEQRQRSPQYQHQMPLAAYFTAMLSALCQLHNVTSRFHFVGDNSIMSLVMDSMGGVYPLVHCDVKPENLLVMADGTLRLADFGSVTQSGCEAKGFTLLYSCPDFHDGQLTSACDVFALSASLLVAAGGHLIYYGDSTNVRTPTQYRKFYETLHDVETFERILLEAGLDQDRDAVFHSILAGMSMDPAHRPITDLFEYRPMPVQATSAHQLQVHEDHQGHDHEVTSPSCHDMHHAMHDMHGVEDVQDMMSPMSSDKYALPASPAAYDTASS